jgi:hypothetical protein
VVVIIIGGFDRRRCGFGCFLQSRNVSAKLVEGVSSSLPLDSKLLPKSRDFLSNGSDKLVIGIKVAVGSTMRFFERRISQIIVIVDSVMSCYNRRFFRIIKDSFVKKARLKGLTTGGWGSGLLHHFARTRTDLCLSLLTRHVARVRNVGRPWLGFVRA